MHTILTEIDLRFDDTTVETIRELDRTVNRADWCGYHTKRNRNYGDVPYIKEKRLKEETDYQKLRRRVHGWMVELFRKRLIGVIVDQEWPCWHLLEVPNEVFDHEDAEHRQRH